MRQRPEAWGKYVTEGAWDEQVDRGTGASHRRAGGAQAALQRVRGHEPRHVLKTMGAKYLLYIGGATNICVSATLMDGFFLDYWPILVADACFSHCPPVTVEGAVWNVENLYGWVTTVDEVLTMVAQA